MGDDEIIVGGVHPLGERIGHSLRQRAGMRRPGHHYFRTGFSLELLDGYEVGEALERMACGGLHAEHGASGVFYELLDHPLLIVLFFVLKSGERANANDVAVASHDRDRLQKMFGFISIHDDTAFGLQFPCSLVHIEHDDVHAKIHGSFLCREARAQGGVEEDHEQGLVAAQLSERVAVFLYHGGLRESFVERTEVVYTCEFFHNLAGSGYCFLEFVEEMVGLLHGERQGPRNASSMT